jgi:DNA ligase-associated metallophosphoesterase
MLTFELCGEPMVLLPQKAAFLPRHRALLVADAHVGKAVSFRRLGVPVPRGTTTETLDGLSVLIEATGAERIIFLGDFLHSPRSHAVSTLGALARWRERHAALGLTLVRGNHDLRAGDPPAELGIRVVDEPLRLGPWALCHHPRPQPGAYVLAGHIHPSVGVGRGFGRLRLPCFWFGAEMGVLPAFGAFTGTQGIELAPGDRAFVVAEGVVVEVPR